MKRFSKKSRRTGTSRGRLAVQRLESRKLMAGDIGLTDSVLSIQGSNADDIAEVYVESDRVHVSVSSYDETGQKLCEHSEEFAVDEVGRILFSGGDGNDLLVNDSAIPVIARGGSGDDMLLGGNGNDVLIGGTGDDILMGGGGDDVILGGPGSNVISNVEVELADNPVDEAAADSLDAVAPIEDVVTAETSSEAVGDASNVADAGDVGPIDSDAVATPIDEVPSEPTEPVNEVPVLAVDDVAGGDEVVNLADDGVPPVTETSQDEEPTVCPAVDTEDFGDDANASLGQTETAMGPVEAVETPILVDAEAVDSTQLDSGSDPSDSQPGMDATTADVVEALPPVALSEPIVDAASDTTEPVDPVAANSDSSDAEDTEVIFDTVISEGEVTAGAEQTAEEESDHDIIFGGPGDDWLMGEGGNDMIFGNMSPIEDALLREVIAGRLRLNA